MKKVLLILLVLLLSTAVFAEAKTGLMLGLGAGIGSYELNIDDYSLESEASMIDAKIGLGFGKLFLFGNYKLFIFDDEDDNPDPDTFGLSIAGFGASYYINKLYITGTIGKAELSCFSDADADEFFDEFEGPGFYFGAGLELINGITLEAGIFNATLSHETVSSVEIENSGFILSANLLFY